jgi:hypothetical protein
MNRVTSFPRGSQATLFIVITLLGFFLYFSGRTAIARSEKPSREYVALDLVAYNYTDHHIEDYEINGQHGDIVRVSSPTSGGSGSVCCVELPLGKYSVILVKVRWQVDGCIYVEKDPFTGSTANSNYYYYREEYVKIPRPVGIVPRHLETHFYPNGSVRVQITEELSRPRLRLSEDRLQKRKFPRCKNDEKPE